MPRPHQTWCHCLEDTETKGQSPAPRPVISQGPAAARPQDRMVWASSALKASTTPWTRAPGTKGLVFSRTAARRAFSQILATLRDLLGWCVLCCLPSPQNDSASTALKPRQVFILNVASLSRESWMSFLVGRCDAFKLGKGTVFIHSITCRQQKKYTQLSHKETELHVPGWVLLAPQPGVELFGLLSSLLVPSPASSTPTHLKPQWSPRKSTHWWRRKVFREADSTTCPPAETAA